MTASIICESCWLDSKRNGRCTEPSCDQYALTGKYHEIHDFIRLCRSCHHRFDAARRRATGRSTRPQEVMPYV